MKTVNWKSVFLLFFYSSDPCFKNTQRAKNYGDAKKKKEKRTNKIQRFSQSSENEPLGAAWDTGDGAAPAAAAAAADAGADTGDFAIRSKSDRPDLLRKNAYQE